jgi:hypothetical protein
VAKFLEAQVIDFANRRKGRERNMNNAPGAPFSSTPALPIGPCRWPKSEARLVIKAEKQPSLLVPPVRCMITLMDQGRFGVGVAAMADIEISQAVVTLAATGLGGFLVGWTQRHMHDVSSTAARMKQREDRLEKIVQLSFAYSNWLDQDVKHNVFGTPVDKQVDHLSGIQAIQELHFPELSDSILAFKNVAYEHARIFSRFFGILRGLPVTPAIQERGTHWNHDEYLAKVFNPLLAARAALIKKCAEIIEADRANCQRSWRIRERISGLPFISRLIRS